jgi:hypothetical protein
MHQLSLGGVETEAEHRRLRIAYVPFRKFKDRVIACQIGERAHEPIVQIHLEEVRHLIGLDSEERTLFGILSLTEQRSNRRDSVAGNQHDLKTLGASDVLERAQAWIDLRALDFGEVGLRKTGTPGSRLLAQPHAVPLRSEFFQNRLNMI